MASGSYSPDGQHISSTGELIPGLYDGTSSESSASSPLNYNVSLPTRISECFQVGPAHHCTGIRQFIWWKQLHVISKLSNAIPNTRRRHCASGTHTSRVGDRRSVRRLRSQKEEWKRENCIIPCAFGRCSNGRVVITASLSFRSDAELRTAHPSELSGIGKRST